MYPWHGMEKSLEVACADDAANLEILTLKLGLLAFLVAETASQISCRTASSICITFANPLQMYA